MAHPLVTVLAAGTKRFDVSELTTDGQIAHIP